MARQSKQKLRSLLINAIIDLCRKESFYLEELRIEGTLCVVSDRSSALIMQITEQVGEKTNSDTEPEDTSVHLLMDEHSSSACDEPNRLIASEVTLDKLDHSIGNWLLGDQSASQNPPAKVAVGGKVEGKHQCPFCPKRYRFKHSLKDHINKHTGNRPHRCKYCALCFMHLGSLCTHVRKRHPQYMLTEYQCRICNERFMSEQFLKQHYTWKHKGEKVAATTDVAPMTANAAGPQHSSAAVGDQSKTGAASEDQCKGSSDPLLTWSNHVGDATKTQDWNPSESNNDMNPNLMNQDGSSAVVKSEPSAVSQNENVVPGHVSSSHRSSSSWQFGAPTMNVDFQQMAQTLSMFSSFPFSRGCNPLGSFGPFTSSYQQNAAVIPAASSDGTKLEDSSNLQRSADGKFQCPYCEKSYNFKHTLKDHINKHLGKRPHVCKHCGDSFVHLASLCAHIKRRHDEHVPTEFRCEICHEKLMNYQSLKQHYTWRHRDSRVSMEANEYSMFLNSVGADAGAEKDPGQQMAAPAFFFPGQPVSSGDVAAGEMKKQKSDMMIPATEFDAVRALDSLLPDEYQIAASSKSVPAISPEVCPSDTVDGREGHSNIFTESLLPSNETVQQMALIAEYFDEIDLQTAQGIFKYKCRVCGNMLKPQTNLSEHLNGHYSSRKSFVAEAGGVSSVGGGVNVPTCLGCNSEFHSALELQRHLEAHPDHLTQPWHQ